MVSSLRFLGHPCGACPGLETPASRPDLAITVAARYCLPLAQTRRPRNDTNFGADPHGLLPCCLRFDTHQSPGEWQDSLLICLLDFDQGRDRAEARAFRHKDQVTFPRAPPAIPEGRISRFRFW